MEKPQNGLGIQSEHSPAEISWYGAPLADFFAGEYTEPLGQESYEHAAEVLERLEAVQRFRKELADRPFASFYELVEAVTKIGQHAGTEEARQQGINKVVEGMQDRADRLSPRVADLFRAFLALLGQEPYEPRFEETRRQMSKLTRVTDQRSDLDILFSSDISWELKVNRLKNVLDGYLAGMRTFDRREGKNMDDATQRWRQEKLRQAPNQPPSQRNRSRPGVDPMERLKEGEKAPAIWTIHPAWGGIYKEQCFTIWDEERKEWVSEPPVYSEVRTVPLSKNLDTEKGPIDLTLTASIVTGAWYSVPSSYKHSFHTVEAQGKTWKMRQNQHGDLFVWVTGNGEQVNIKVIFGPDPQKKYTDNPSKIKIPNMPAIFSEETNEALREIAAKYKGNIPRGLAIRRYVKSRIQYLAPKDQEEAAHYNAIYRTSPKYFAGGVDEAKKGDCDVVNTYFTALCARLKVPARHVIGHSVKGADAVGNSVMHSGTGHGWTEVWDEVAQEWKDMDSTPSGDPNLEEGSTEGGSGRAPGYYGQQEAVCPSSEQLEELRKKLAEHKERLSYTREERALAEATGVELKEARQIVKEINKAELTRLPNGELIVDVLARVFDLIVESRKTQGLGYTGPVRESEGGEEIEDLVQHYIEAKSGEMDPRSRTLSTKEKKEEKLLGGVDVIIIGDKSGSMQSADESGTPLWQIQRLVEYLLFSSLYRFEKKLELAGLHKDRAISVRTQAISFRGDGKDDIDLDKTLTSTFTAQDKVRMWHSTTRQGLGNGDPEALAYVYEQIKAEIEANKQEGKTERRLRVIIACSDGGYIGEDAARMRMLAEKLHELDPNIIVIGMGLTETAAQVPIVMDNPPFSRGDLAKTINYLPALVAKHVILEAIKLFPEKAREDAMPILKKLIAMFNRAV